MKISEKGIALICQFEGFKSKPYQDVKGVWTIGYGTTIYPNGNRVAATDAAITKEQGIEYLRHHVDTFVSAELSALNLKQNQYDALASFIYNCGVNAFRTSTLRKDVINGATPAKIEADFMLWNKSGGKVVDGLTNRRKAEAKLYNA